MTTPISSLPLGLASPGRGPRARARDAASERGCSARAIRLLALHDALVLCLTMLDEDPDGFRRAAATWHARWCTRTPQLTLADAAVARDALEALPGPAGADGARALRELSALHGLHHVAAVLDDWLLDRTGTTAQPT